VPKTRSIRLNVLTEHRLVTDRHMAVASTALAYRRARKIGRWRESGEKERRAHTTAPSRPANVKLFIVFRYIFLCALVYLPYKAYPVCVTRSVLKPLNCSLFIKQDQDTAQHYVRYAMSIMGVFRLT